MLTLKLLCLFILNLILLPNGFQYYCVNPVQYNEYSVGNVDTDGLVLSTKASVATVPNTHPCVSSR